MLFYRAEFFSKNLPNIRYIISSFFKNWCFIAFLRRNFRLCCSMGPNFSRKNLSKIRYIFEKFFKKINVLCFKTVSNGKILKNFDEIAYKTPHRLFLENFRKFRKISKIFENLTPKTPQISLFIAFLRRNFWPSVLFYGSKKPILCCWDPPRGRVPPK